MGGGRRRGSPEQTACRLEIIKKKIFSQGPEVVPIQEEESNRLLLLSHNHFVAIHPEGMIYTEG